MSLNDYNDLNDTHRDVLKEICNIGSGNAATSLSQMFGISIDINVPEVEILDFDNAMNRLGGVETVAAGVFLSTHGDVNGMIMYILPFDFAGLLLNTLMGVELSNFDEIDELGMSAIDEMANIASASFVSAIVELTGMAIDISPPSSTIDMVGAMMNVPVVYCADISDRLLLMKNVFIWGGEEKLAHILVIPDIDSLTNLIVNLGIEV